MWYGQNFIPSQSSRLEYERLLGIERHSIVLLVFGHEIFRPPFSNVSSTVLSTFSLYVRD